MGNIIKLLSNTSHRPFELPIGKWKYYQEWNEVLFFHWKVPYETLRKVVPFNLSLDAFQGLYYVSLVPFTMQKIRPNYLPAFHPISDFHEINLRTYVVHNGKKGVYFLSMEAQKHISVFMSKKLSGLPYVKSTISRSEQSYRSVNKKKKLFLDVRFSIGEELQSKTELDQWLTERYCLYLEENNEIHRYDVHHEEWKLKQLKVLGLKLNYALGDFDLSKHRPDLIHYSDGVSVIAWSKEKVVKGMDGENK